MALIETYIIPLFCYCTPSLFSHMSPCHPERHQFYHYFVTALLPCFPTCPHATHRDIHYTTILLLHSFSVFPHVPMALIETYIIPLFCYCTPSLFSHMSPCHPERHQFYHYFVTALLPCFPTCPHATHRDIHYTTILLLHSFIKEIHRDRPLPSRHE